MRDQSWTPVELARVVSDQLSGQIDDAVRRSFEAELGDRIAPAVQSVIRQLAEEELIRLIRDQVRASLAESPVELRVVLR